MRKIVVGIATAALALTCCAIDSPAQASPAHPTEPTSLQVLQTVRTDVNGDGKVDSVILSSVSGGTLYELKVATTKVTAMTRFTANVDPLANQLWAGTAELDGVKGSEIIIRIPKPDTIGDFTVFTWRKGSLVAETAPAAPSRAGWWSSDLHGFRFFTSRGRAYVDAAHLASASTNGAHRAKIVRSVWRSGKWVKVSTRTVKLSASRVDDYTGIQAPSILMNQARVDMDGDGKLDTVAYRLLSGNRTQTKIATVKGKIIKRTIGGQDFGGPALIATIDGTPGAELAYPDGDGYTWKILTLRKGKLVVSRSPEGKATWTRSPEDWDESYDLGVDKQGEWQLVTRAHAWGSSTITVHWARYRWVAGKWVKQTVWTTVATEAELKELCSGFCGVTTIQL